MGRRKHDSWTVVSLPADESEEIRDRVRAAEALGAGDSTRGTVELRDF